MRYTVRAMYDHGRHDDRRATATTPRRTCGSQYLKLTHPDKSDEEIAKMVRKENRYTWLVRFQILAFLLIIIAIILLIFTN